MWHIIRGMCGNVKWQSHPCLIAVWCLWRKQLISGSWKAKRFLLYVNVFHNDFVLMGLPPILSWRNVTWALCQLANRRKPFIELLISVSVHEIPKSLLLISPFDRLFQTADIMPFTLFLIHRLHELLNHCYNTCLRHVFLWLWPIFFIKDLFLQFCTPPKKQKKTKTKHKKQNNKNMYSYQCYSHPPPPPPSWFA